MNWTSVSSVTYNGAPLQVLKSLNSIADPNEATTASHDEVWYLLNPQTGNHDVVVNLNGNDTVVAGSVTFNNVDPTTPFGNIAANTGISNTPSTSLTTNANQLVFDNVIWKDNYNSIAANSGQTTLWNQITSPNLQTAGGSSYTSPVSGTTTVGWQGTPSLDVEEWAQIAVPLNPAGGVSPVPTPSPTGPYAITGNIWVDVNANGTMQPNESGYSGGGTVSLSGNATATAPIDGSGNYVFKNLSQGTYTVTYNTPAGFKGTTPVSQTVTFP